MDNVTKEELLTLLESLTEMVLQLQDRVERLEENAGILK